MKMYKLFAFTLLFGTYSQAQNLQEAIKKTENERFDVAEKDFKSLIAKEPTRADYYFYFGDNYFQHEDFDLANSTWEKGVGIDPEFALNFVGMAKYLWYKGDTTAANLLIDNVNKLNKKKKDPEVYRQLASMYINTPTNKKLDEALVLLEAAIKLDPKNQDNFLLKGDALLEKDPVNGSPAIKNFNLALGLNPQSSKALVRTAKLYQRSGNNKLASDKYKEAETLDPTYAPAYREHAELSMKMDHIKSAIENWEKYLSLNNSTEARYRYATSLFSGAKYCETLGELKTVQSEGFNNFYVERMFTYSYAECENSTEEDYNKGLKSSDAFFKVAPKDKVIALDFKYKGLLLSKLGKDSLAIIELEKAAGMDTSKAGEILSEVAEMYNSAKKYPEAISTYERIRKGNWANLTILEIYKLGRAYYFGVNDYALADSSFTHLAMRDSTYSPAYLWRARANFKQDQKNEKWLAKVHYAKFIETLSEEEAANPGNKGYILEACRYLGDYYVNSPEKDYAKAKEYWGRVKALEPEDKQAAYFFASPAGK